MQSSTKYDDRCRADEKGMFLLKLRQWHNLFTALASNILHEQLFREFFLAFRALIYDRFDVYLCVSLRLYGFFVTYLAFRAY